MASRGTRAREVNAGDRLPQHWLGRPVCSQCTALKQGLIETGYIEDRNVLSNTAGRKVTMIDCPPYPMISWAAVWT
jgi:hypothetical protein